MTGGQIIVAAIMAFICLFMLLFGIDKRDSILRERIERAEQRIVALESAQKEAK